MNFPYISNEFSRSTVGGNTWTPGQVIQGTAVYDISNISAVNADTAWAAIYYSGGVQDSNCGVYKTTDGGLNWVQQFAIEDGTTSFVNNVYFWNANEGMFHGDVRDGYFEIYTTTNGGDTWVRVAQSDISATVEPGGEYGNIRAFETVGDSMICFITSASNLYISYDRGYHWVGKPTGIEIPPNCWSQNIAFRDNNHGLIGFASLTSTSMNVHETSDGGNTWTLVNHTGPINLFALDYVPGSPNTYVSTGQNASMMKNSRDFIHFENELESTAVANSGVTYSFDGGHTWKKMTSTDGKHFLAVKWLNDSVAYSGSWNNNPNNDGMYKFKGRLAEADFTTSDTAIGLGEQVVFSITSGDFSTSTINWIFQGGIPASSTLRNPVVTYNTSGLFTATLNISNTWGISTKVKIALINVGNVGVEKVLSAHISISPNPADDFLNIVGDMPILKVEIFDLLGREMLSRNMIETDINIQTSELNPGVYSMNIYMKNETVNRKIVIK